MQLSTRPHVPEYCIVHSTQGECIIIQYLYGRSELMTEILSTEDIWKELWIGVVIQYSLLRNQYTWPYNIDVIAI